MLSASRSCAAPPLIECPLIWLTCFAGIPIHRATQPLPYPALANESPENRSVTDAGIVQPNLEPLDRLAGEIGPTPLPWRSLIAGSIGPVGKIRTNSVIAKKSVNLPEVTKTPVRYQSVGKMVRRVTYTLRAELLDP